MKIERDWLGGGRDESEEEGTREGNGGNMLKIHCRHAQNYITKPTI